MIITFKEIILRILINLSALILSLIIFLILNEYCDPYFKFTIPFIILPFITAFILISKIKKNIQTTKYVLNDLEKIGYKILSEHNFKLSEFPFEIKINTRGSINHIPLSRFDYFRKFYRKFIVVNDQEEKFEIKAEIINHWNGDNTINILNTTAI